MSPKEKFKANKTLTRGYNDLIFSFQIQSAMDAAAREQDLSMPIVNTMEAAAANRWRKEGADMFRRILENLNADGPSNAVESPATLNYQT